MSDNHTSANTAADNNRRSMAEKRFRTKIAINLILIILGSVFIALFLQQMQVHVALEKQRQMSETAVYVAVSQLERNKENADLLVSSYHSGNQAVLDDINILLSGGLIDHISLTERKSSSGVINDIASRSGADILLLLSADGKIVLCSDAEVRGRDPVKEGLMTAEELEKLLHGTRKKDETVVPVESDCYGGAGTFYYYSRPFENGGERYMLVLGSYAAALDAQVDSMLDISHTLRQDSVGQNGFIFAVDKETGKFLYYVNGDDERTGESIEGSGLSEDALTDSYSGTQEIYGSQYYCYSSIFDDSIVVCTAARNSEIYASSRYILLWSVLAFVLIMLICLAYSVIVRNDYVRRSVVTDKLILRKDSEKPLFFDKSVFRKVFPLMISGVLVMFCISFYAQTMLELSDAMISSQEKVDMISSEYGEKAVDLDAVQEYYNHQLIAKANLIAFLLETDPDALNMASNHYHFYYDKKDRKQFVKDSDGRRIKSVGSSKMLQNYCDSNDIESIYVFDEGGRTIGTNTPNWFFTISHDKDDQSYEFLEVLDGKKDSLVQDPMEDDLGESTQFIGVAFKYYTQEDENGNTVYISIYDADPSTVESHSSMIQIGLDAGKAAALLSATDYSNMLASGDSFIRMFAYDDDHHCMYSLAENEIGKTAEELDVPEEALDEVIYCRMQGFGGYDEVKFYQESSGYFFETLMLNDSIYHNRFIIALITSLLSFVLILILCFSVTVTSKEEEELFAGEYFSRKRFSWLKGDPEDKLILMIRIIAGILALILIIAAIASEHSYERYSMLRIIVDDNWNRGLNIFAFSEAALMIVCVVLVVSLLRIILRLLPSLFGSRGKTIGRLLISVAEYGGAMAVVFYSLYLFGADTSKLLAGAGIMTLIIGFGAQSLIKDIISGMFIVFEGEFQVGDIVIINGHRGIVHDIGMRTTKVLGIDDEEGNLKIFNNSEITEVLNMTYEPSWIVSKICIEYGQDISYVEEVVKRELPRVRKECPYMLTDPEYRGVNNFGDSGIELVFFCTCSELNVRKVRRALNRSLIQIFYDNGISVPSINITISQLDTSGRKTIEDLKDTKHDE